MKIIPSLICQFLNNKNYIKVGSTYPIRDLTFVDDTVNGFIKLIENKKNLNGKIINLGTNSGLSVKELIIKISKVMSIKKILVEKELDQKYEVDKLISSNKIIKKILKWSPKYKSNNIESFKITINWFKNSKNLENISQKNTIYSKWIIKSFQKNLKSY